MTEASPRVHLTAASERDLADVRALVRASYSKYIERIGREPAPMTEDYAAVIAGQRVTLAWTGQVLIGMIVTESATDHLHISNIAVDPCAQGLGVGSLLLAHAEAEARGLGRDELRLYTNAQMHENLEYYPRRGYVVTGRRTEDGFDRVYFTKVLSDLPGERPREEKPGLHT